jgi:hypothetical protein
MRDIAEHRRFMAACLADAKLLPDEHQSDTSPSRRYQLDIDVYAASEVADYGGEFSVAVIIDRRDGAQIAVIHRDHHRFWHAWITRDNVEYLVCSEDLEGQTVVDLTNRKIASVTCENDPFIWTDFHLSNDGKMLAVMGCYWACPYMVTVYDFRDPTSLPLPTVVQFTIPSDGKFGRWVTSKSFTIVSEGGKTEVFEIPSAQ